MKDKAFGNKAKDSRIKVKDSRIKVTDSRIKIITWIIPSFPLNQFLLLHPIPAQNFYPVFPRFAFPFSSSQILAILFPFGAFFKTSFFGACRLPGSLRSRQIARGPALFYQWAGGNGHVTCRKDREEKIFPRVR